LSMRGHFRYLSFKTFPMTPRTPQCEVFWALLLSSEHLRVPEDSQPPTFPNVGLHPHTWPKWGCDTNHVPTKDFKDICMNIIKACGGLPLSLKVLGSFLCNTKELETWQGALRKLKSGQNLMRGNDDEELWNVLKISYDHLDKQHQNMFLDIVCFLGGLKISTICRVWNGDYLNQKFELQNLQHRSLVQLVEDGILYINEQLQEMGQNIAMELPIVNRFIWKSNESNFLLQKDEVVIILLQSYNFIFISYEFFMSRMKCFNFEF